MTLGFPTIVIPALKGGEGRIVDTAFSLNDEQISWFSESFALAYSTFRIIKFNYFLFQLSQAQ